MTIALAANDLIVVSQNQPRTTSLKIAEAFGKRHTHVLEKIQNLDCSDQFTSANFSAHDEVIQAGAVKRKSKVYEMTKDGFMFLVMGFTGKKAAQVKEAYINAFNEMATKLYGKPAPAKKRTAKALPNGLTIEQQDTIKSLVKARVDSLPPERRAKAAITCWSSLKSKFGCTYKEIEPEHFTDAVSLVARVPLEGEYIEAEKPASALTQEEISQLRCLFSHVNSIERKFGERLGPALKLLSEPLFYEFREHIFVSSRQAKLFSDRYHQNTGQKLLA